MGIVKGILKVGASAVLTATGVASTVLKGMSDTVGFDIGSEVFGVAKDASFNGIRNMWDIDSPPPEKYRTKGEARRAEFDKEINRMKVMALRNKELAQKAEDESVRDRFMAQYEDLWEQAHSMVYEEEEDDNEPYDD